jgi:inhibitor of KinA sporulation pathway (predicted exonuclease)
MACLRNALYLDEETFYFGRRFIDVKTVFISYQWANNFKHQAGLANALTKLSLNFQGKKHNAKDDAKNTFLIFHELLRRFKNA